MSFPPKRLPPLLRKKTLRRKRSNPPTLRKLLWKLYMRRVTVRFVGSGFSNFQADEGQLELFTDASLARFHAAVDAIRDKFGHGAIVAGRAIDLLGKLPHDAYGYVLRTPSLTK